VQADFVLFVEILYRKETVPLQNIMKISALWCLEGIAFCLFSGASSLALPAELYWKV